MTEVITGAGTPGVRAAASDSDEEFRSALRSWLTGHHPGRRPKDPAERFAWQKAWLAKLYDAGFAGPSWPREYGGMDLPFARQVIYQEEYARARVPGPLGTGLGIIGPTLITYGTEEQKRRFLPSRCCAGTRSGRRASPNRKPGRICSRCAPRPAATATNTSSTGRRCGTPPPTSPTSSSPWCALAHASRGHKGISYLLIDAHAPGVTIRPLRDITGGADFSEIFFDDVRVPVSNRIGEENDGWRLVRNSLGHERAAGTMNQAAMYRRVLTELIELARSRGATADPIVRDRLADFEIRVRIMGYQGMRTIESILTKGEPGPGASTSRLFITAFEQDLHEFAVDLLGSYGTLGRTDPHSVERGRWVWGFLRTRASTIGTGTSEIQRNTVAEQVLGLPYDPAMPPR